MNRGLSRADVMVLGIVLLILGLLVPPLMAQQREHANRTSCAANLRGILSACVIYSSSGSDAFPFIGGTSATTYDATVKPALGKETADETIAALYKDKLYPNNPYAAIWLLVLDGMSPKLFICKDDPFVVKPAEATNGKLYYQNFQEGKNVSYSLAYMWQEDENREIRQARWWRNNADASIPVMSDMAPYLGEKAAAGEVATQPVLAPTSQPSDVLVIGNDEKPSLATRRSPNHGYAGQNVVYSDVHVEFHGHADIGQEEDNIWTQKVDGKQRVIEAGKLAAPLTATEEPFDIVMVPMRSAKGDLK